MGAIIMSALVSVIAIVGGVYFWIQDKKETRKDMWLSAFGGVVLLKYIYGQPFCIIFLFMGRKC